MPHISAFINFSIGSTQLYDHYSIGRWNTKGGILVEDGLELAQQFFAHNMSIMVETEVGNIEECIYIQL